MVFLKSLRPWDWDVLHGLARSIRGLQNVMHLTVFLELPGVRDVETLRESTWDCATRFGTLNCKISSLCGVAQESRI